MTACAIEAAPGLGAERMSRRDSSLPSFEWTVFWAAAAQVANRINAVKPLDSGFAAFFGCVLNIKAS